MALNFGNQNGQTLFRRQSKTWSGSGVIFQPEDSVKEVRYSFNTIRIMENLTSLSSNVKLPDNATITGAIVFGTASAETVTWELSKNSLTAASGFVIATNTINSGDNTVSGIRSVVDTENFTIGFEIFDANESDRIFGAKIFYTIEEEFI